MHGEESAVLIAGVVARLVCCEHKTIVDCSITKLQGDKCTFQYQPMSPGILALPLHHNTGNEVRGSLQANRGESTQTCQNYQWPEQSSWCRN